MTRRALLCVIFALASASSPRARAGFELYVADFGSGSHAIERIDGAGDKSIYGYSGSDSPYYLTTDAAGNLFSSNLASGTIHEIRPGGVDAGDIVSGILSPTGIVVGPDGNLYVAQDRSGSLAILKFGTDGTPLGTFAATGLLDPLGIAFDHAGNLYVANGTDGTIHEFSATGADRGIFASGFNVPTGLAFDAAGHLFVSTVAGDIFKFGADGTPLGTFATGLSSPGSLAIDPVSGDVFAPSYYENAVYRYSSAGVLVQKYDALNITPWGIALRSVPEPPGLAGFGIGGLILAVGYLRRRLTPAARRLSVP